MNITVIGSTGRTGTHLIVEGARRGHQVTALTRRPNALTDRDALADVVNGDGRDPDAVVRAVAGADAVIAILGPPSRHGPHHSAEMAGVITTAMQRTRVRRLVVTSAYPLVADTPRLPIAVLRRVFAAAYADAAALEDAVTVSGLEWTIARLNRLTDARAQAGTRISSDLFTRPSALSRADAAAALLTITESNDHLKTAVDLAGPSRTPVRTHHGAAVLHRHPELPMKEVYREGGGVMRTRAGRGEEAKGGRKGGTETGG